MMKTFRSGCVLALALGSAPAMAGVHFVPSAPGMTVDPNNANVWKTAPMNDGDQLVIQWAVHTKFPATHWAGVRFTAHVLDSNEVTLSNIIINAGLLPAHSIAGPAGSSIGVGGTWWHPQALQSGISIGPSQVFGFGSWTITVTGTTPANNSDVDMTAVAWSIFHLGSLPESSHVLLEVSDYVWASSGFEPVPGDPFPEDPPQPGDGLGQWKHVSFTTSWHVPPGFPQQSGFYSKLIGGAGLGIEHVPAPGVGLIMLAGGYGALGARRRTGRRRLS